MPSSDTTLVKAPGFLQCDFHTHTVLSGEAQAEGFTLERLFAAADEIGLLYVGYSEHWHLDATPDRFRRIRDEIEQLQPHHHVKVWLSAEIDVLNSRGDLACDPELALELLDYVSVAISHYGTPGVEQLLPDRLDDTVRMIESVCVNPAVTMLMHPQIVYGRSLEHISEPVPESVYQHVLATVARQNKVVDYASVRMIRDWLAELGYSQRMLDIEAESFRRYTRQVIAQGVRLAPGSDAHHAFWRGGPLRWFGNNEESYALLVSEGYQDDQLWWGLA